MMANVIWILSLTDENLDHLNKLNCVGLVMDAVQTHIKQPKLVKNACMALAAMVEPDGNHDITSVPANVPAVKKPHLFKTLITKFSYFTIEFLCVKFSI